MVSVTTKHKLQQMIEIGKQQANRDGANVLVSVVSSADRMDPFSFFSLDLPGVAGSRFFWTDPVRNTTFVGLGEVIAYEPGEIEPRFQEIHRFWKEISGRALVTEGAPERTGPLFFGGFSFHPENPASEEWRRFPHTRFVVPQYMLTLSQEKAWLTFNGIVSPGANGDRFPDVRSFGDASSAFSSFDLPLAVHQEEIERNRWIRSVEEAAASIQSGELEKIVLARELKLFADREFAVPDVLRKLCTEQENTYVFAFVNGEDCFIGATPELLAKNNGDEIVTACLAGSIARGKTEHEDRRLGTELSNDPKNLHEHALAAQMIEDAMRDVCSSVRVSDQPELYKLKDIQHLYTPISGQAKEGVSLLKVVEALHPTPALGGLPRQAAMNAIRKLETMDRGWYAAPIGWLNRRMDGEFAAAIRSALIQGKEATLFAGCGIVGSSNPISEYEETVIKFKPMLSALYTYSP